MTTTKDKINRITDPLQLAKGTAFDYSEITPNEQLQFKPIPMGHIGEIAEVISAISRITQNHEALALQGILSALAVASQKNYQVRYFDNIKPCPLSLFMLTIAKSGTGKSTVSEQCYQALEAIQSERMVTYRKEMADYRRQLNGKGSKGKKGDSTPIKPLSPLFILKGGTIEGMIDTVGNNGMGFIYADEAATLLGGHSAKPENLLKMLGSLSSLWSHSKHSEAKRGDDEPKYIVGDLTLFMNAQPEIIKPIFLNDTWRNQGTIPRFLVTEPPIKRVKREKGFCIDPDDQQIVNAFNAIIRRIFEVLPCTEGKYTVEADADAEGLFNDFHNEMIDRGQHDYMHIESYANRATEHAARIAGLLAIYRTFSRVAFAREHKGNITLTKQDALHGINLMRFYLHEYSRLSNPDLGRDFNKEALALFERMKGWDWGTDGLTFAKINSSKTTMDKKDLEKLISILHEHNYLIGTQGERAIRYSINPSLANT